MIQSNDLHFINRNHILCNISKVRGKSAGQDKAFDWFIKKKVFVLYENYDLHFHKSKEVFTTTRPTCKKESKNLYSLSIV